MRCVYPPRLFWHRRKRRRLRSQEDDLRRGPRRGDSGSARAFRACYMSAACVYTLAHYARARLSLGPLSVFSRVRVCVREDIIGGHPLSARGGSGEGVEGKFGDRDVRSRGRNPISQ